jgi:hypothetical protein
MISTEQALLTLATEELPDLTEAEKKLIRAVATGEEADYSRLNVAENDPNHAENWGDSRTIRATVIRWLCVNHEAIRYIDPFGIDIKAAKIDGELNLEAVVIPFQLLLTQCAICNGVALSLAKTHTLQFDGSFIGDSHRFALQADGVTVDGVVSLCEGFRAEGGVCLTGARITSNLACQGGMVRNPGTIALQLSGITVGGDVFLRWGFQAQGGVQLIGAAITGDLDCDGGIFYNPLGTALSAERMTVGGALLFRAGFQAEGGVRLMGAKVGVLSDDEDSWPAPGKLWLRDFVYATIDPLEAKSRLSWLERQPRKPFSPQPYQQLAKVLRESGHEADAKRVLIAKERARRKHGELGWWASAWSMLLGVTIGHGYRPWRVLLWASCWIVLGGILFDAGYDKGIVIPAKAEAYHADKKTKQETAFYPAFNQWLYSLDTFVPIINFGQKDYWGPQVACNRSGLIRGGGIRLCILEIRVLYLYRWVHIIVGYVLITLVVAGVTGLVRKE